MAVSWATANGVVSGMGKEMFGPNAPLTREQLALILYHYAQVAGYAPHQGGMAIQEFSDSASISGWALEAVQWAVNAGLNFWYWRRDARPRRSCNPRSGGAEFL